MIYTFFAVHIPNLVTDYTVLGLPPLLIIYSSSIITFPAAAVLAIIAIKSYLKTKDIRNLSIVAGVIVVSVAGTLYIVQFPSLLYLAEFIGIAMLWIGFYRPKG